MKAWRFWPLPEDLVLDALGLVPHRSEFADEAHTRYLCDIDLSACAGPAGTIIKES